ncbi:glycosyltransferase family 4 protein [Halomontanus rarus]|uniref:glycosyltransferase family 4 protein n=1 Tax=Halomontanus rarus TaxID=3034020 RepID=UPI0023E7A27C|nr:glycosyltransferase [Halovivax sp. TS33]
MDREHAAYGAVQNFIDIYNGDVDRITVVGPNEIKLDRSDIKPVPVQRPSSHVIVPRALNYVWFQFRIARAMWQERDHVDTAFFHIGGSLLLLPLLASKITNIRVLIFITGSIEDGFLVRNDTGLLSEVFVWTITLVERLTCTLADDVIALSKQMDTPDTLWSSSRTDRAANLNYIDCEEFSKRTRHEDRTVDIVFVGRFAPVKGIESLLYAIPAIVELHPDVRIKLIGAGELTDEVESFVETHNLTENVILTGWVDNEELPAHLDDARTLLMPSKSEGVPKALLEAMACGTVPVAASVGGIPDIVADGENGFLLRETDPDRIARTMTTVLEREDLDEISDNSRRYIEDHHSYPTVKNRYHEILLESELG